MIARLVEPELLDSLPSDDPQAVHSRRDLRLINAWMRNAHHLAKAISSLPEKPVKVLELGTGDGNLVLKLAPEFSPKAEVFLLDMQPVVSAETVAAYRRRGWNVEVVSARIEDWLCSTHESFDLIIANLFLHHFQDDQLRELFARLSRITRAFVSCDPRRWTPALWSAQLLWILGCNAVTRHDARLSIRAGFRDGELSRLWPSDSGFTVREEAAGFSSHIFLARHPK